MADVISKSQTHPVLAEYVWLMTSMGEDAAAPRRILLVTKNEFREERDGGSKRVAAVVRALESAGYKVDFVAVRPMITSQYEALPRLSMSAVLAAVRVVVACLLSGSMTSMKWLNPRAALIIARLTLSGRYSAAVVEYSHLFMYRVALPQPVAIDLHNIESELLANYASKTTSRPRKIAAKYESQRTRVIESAVLKDFDVAAVVSPHDRELLVDLSASASSAAIVVASNGVSDDCFEYAGSRRPTVVFVAHLGWRPNIDAAVWLVREVWPNVRRQAPELTLQLVGRTPSPEVEALRADDIEVIPDVPETVPFVGAASVATAPLLAAGGTRLKILEALASGTPLVATTLGVLGLEHLAGSQLRISDDPSDFAQHLVALANSTNVREASRELVESYRWTTALAPLLAALNDSLGEVR